MKTFFVAFCVIALVQFSIAAPVEDKQEQQDLGFSLGGSFGPFSGGARWGEQELKQAQENLGRYFTNGNFNGQQDLGFSLGGSFGPFKGNFGWNQEQLQQAMEQLPQE